MATTSQIFDQRSFLQHLVGVPGLREKQDSQTAIPLFVYATRPQGPTTLLQLRNQAEFKIHLSFLGCLFFQANIHVRYLQSNLDVAYEKCLADLSSTIQGAKRQQQFCLAFLIPCLSNSWATFVALMFHRITSWTIMISMPASVKNPRFSVKQFFFGGKNNLQHISPASSQAANSA